MKNLVLVLFVLVSFGTVSTAQIIKEVKQAESVAVEKQAEKKAGPIMTFENDKKECDFGEIEQNSDRDRYVKFTNTGTEPLLITNARGSCGCTVPAPPKHPIMPGETEKIKITYATNRLGKINKTVTITTNEGGKPHQIRVVGFVKKKEEALPPAKKSVIGG